MNGRSLMLWCAAVLAAAAAFVVHLTLSFETVRLGYDVGRARGLQRQLTESRLLLSLEAATLRQAGRVETVARGQLGMDVPGAPRIVSVGGKAPASRPAGRLQ